MSSHFVFKPTKKFIFNPRPKEDRPLKSYHIEKLAPVQKNFNTIKPVRPFNRFGLPKISNSGIDPSTVFINFNQKDPNQPNLNQDSSVYDDFQNKYIPTEPQKWSVGYTYTCKDERLIPKKQQYRDYYFLKRNKQDEEKFKDNYLPTDHISIRMPKISKSVDIKDNLENKFYPYLKMKSEFGTNQNSDSYWVPQIQNKATMSNKSSVGYNIITNFDDISPKADGFGILDKASNNKKKGVAEFSDYLKPFNYNPNKRYLKCFEDNNNRFRFYKGVFSELYDSAAKNGNIYMPFRGVDHSKDKEI